MRKLFLTLGGFLLLVTGVAQAPSAQATSAGITWTSQASAANNAWRSVTYGNGLFVAVSLSGSGNRVMTSPDGITWTARTSAADNVWRSVTYGNGLFVAVSEDGTGNRVMTSRTIGGGGSSTDSETLPAPIVLEFGKPASGTCEAAAPVSLNWAGVPSGGWANSWSQWMNGGTGGFVCTRTLVYSSTQAKWVIG